MRERFQHWFDIALADPRQRISAVWFIGRGRPQEKHAPLQLMMLLAVLFLFLACWNIVSVPMLWKEWRLSNELTDSLTQVDEGIVSLIVTHENIPLDSALPNLTRENITADYQPDLSPILFPYTRIFEPNLHPVQKAQAVATKEFAETIAVKEIAEVVAVKEVTEEVTAKEAVAKPIETTPDVPQEIVRIGQWKKNTTDEGVEIEFNVGNRRGGKLSGYLWGLATFETENGETHTVAVPDAVFSSDAQSPDNVKDGEHFATKRFRRTRWNLAAPVAEAGQFTKIIVGIADEKGHEILREEHRM